MFYSPSTKGFYIAEIHNSIPEDAVEITEIDHANLLEGQSEGKVIDIDLGGKPTLKDPPNPSLAEFNEMVSVYRRVSYQKEADPLFFKYQRGEVTEQEWLDKIGEIKVRYPKPDENAQWRTFPDYDVE